MCMLAGRGNHIDTQHLSVAAAGLEIELLVQTGWVRQRSRFSRDTTTNSRLKGQNTASKNLLQYGSLDRPHASLQRNVPLPKYKKKSRPNKGTLPFANQV
ncbi:uncharacterized [Tachysurus ichikawai]